MLTKADIEAKLKQDPEWEPDSSASDEEWDLYYEVLDSMEFETDGDDSEEDDKDWDEDDGYEDEDMDWEDM
jgi:hypothetical protein